VFYGTRRASSIHEFVDLRQRSGSDRLIPLLLRVLTWIE
jgi:hypothetical protein